MTHRAYKNYGGSERLDSFRDFDRTPAAKRHAGRCACGVETSSTVAGIGFECRECYEVRIKQEIWNVDPRR